MDVETYAKTMNWPTAFPTPTRVEENKEEDEDEEQPKSEEEDWRDTAFRQFRGTVQDFHGTRAVEGEPRAVLIPTVEFQTDNSVNGVLDDLVLNLFGNDEKEKEASAEADIVPQDGEILFDDEENNIVEYRGIPCRWGHSWECCDGDGYCDPNGVGVLVGRVCQGCNVRFVPKGAGRARDEIPAAGEYWLARRTPGLHCTTCKVAVCKECPVKFEDKNKSPRKRGRR